VRAAARTIMPVTRRAMLLTAKTPGMQSKVERAGRRDQRGTPAACSVGAARSSACSRTAMPSWSSMPTRGSSAIALSRAANPVRSNADYRSRSSEQSSARAMDRRRTSAQATRKYPIMPVS
jgi:hypothetical protein